jgi:hypothetical protein
MAGCLKSSGDAYLAEPALSGAICNGERKKVVPRRSANVTQADIARAIRAMRDAGYQEVRVVFRDGAVMIEAVPKGPTAPPDPMRIIPL